MPSEHRVRTPFAMVSQYPPHIGLGHRRGSCRTRYIDVPVAGWRAADAETATAETTITETTVATRLTMLVRYARAPRRHRARGGGLLRILRSRRRHRRRAALHPPRRPHGTRGDGDVSRRDRHHRRGRGHHLLVSRRGGRGLRRARWAARDGGRARRYRLAAARQGEHAHVRLRRPPRRHRHLPARDMSASTIVFAIALGLTAGVLAGMFGVGG